MRTGCKGEYLYLKERKLHDMNKSIVTSCQQGVWNKWAIWRDWEKRGAYTVLVCKPERKTPIRRPRHRRENVYKITFRKSDGKRLLRKS